MTPKVLAIVGLSLDAVGALLLILFPPKVPRRGFLELEGGSPVEETFELLRDWLWWSGPTLLFVGFVLLIIAAYISPPAASG